MSESENTEDSKVKSDDPCEAIEERRAKVKAGRERARLEQRAKDLAAIADIEEESGLELKTLETQGRHVEGVPVVVAVRPPSKSEYNRFTAQVRASKESSMKRGDAQDLLSKACIVYPEKDSTDLRALFENFPGTLNSVAGVVAKLAELQSEDEKKG